MTVLWLLLALGFLALCAFVAISIERLAGRWITLLEKASERPSLKPFESIPPDLLNFANQHEVAWAREDMRKHLYELYAEAGDWNKVRHAIMQESSE